MKKILTVLICIFAVIFFAAAVRAVEVIDPPQDERLVDAYQSYLKGVEMEARGDKAFRVRPGEARRLYEQAEDYYLDSAYKYKQSGIENDTDTSEEKNMCDKMYRRVHVKTSDAMGKSRRSTRM